MNLARSIISFVKRNPKATIGGILAAYTIKKSHGEVWHFNDKVMVTDKYTKIEEGHTKYMIVDSEGKIYSFENSAWRLKWDRAERWAEIKTDDWYQLSGTGFRSSFFGLYPKVFYANKL